MSKHKIKYTILLALTLLLWCGEELQAQTTRRDSLLQQLQAADNPDDRSRLMVELGWTLWLSYPDSAFGYAQEALELTKQTGNQDVIALAQHLLGTVYYMKDDYPKAYNLLKTAHEQLDSLGNYYYAGQALLGLGSVYVQIGDFDEGISYFLKAREMAQQHNFVLVETRALNNIGFITHRLKRYDEAIQYYKEALKLANQSDDPTGSATFMMNLGTAYFESHELDSALHYFQIGAAVSKASNNQVVYATNLVNIGTLYSEQNNKAEAAQYLDDAVALARELDNKNLISSALYNLGKLHHSQQNAALAIESLSEGLDISRSIGNKELMVDIALLLAEVYASDQKFEKALEYYAYQKVVSDSVVNATALKNMDEQIVRHEVEQQEKAIEKLKVSEELQELKIQQGRRVQYSLGGGLVLVAIAGWWLFSLYRVNRRKKEETDKANAAIQEIEHFRDLVTEMIVGELEGHTQRILNLSQPPIQEAAANRIRKAGQVMQSTVLNLLDLQKFEEKGIDLDLDFYAIDEAIQAAIDNPFLLPDEKKGKIKHQRNEAHGTEYDKELMTRVLYSVLQLICLHASGEQPVVVSTVLKENSEPQLKIKIKAGPVQKYLRPETWYAQLEWYALPDRLTVPEKIGMSFTKMVLDAHEGSIHLNLQPNNTEITIALPFDPEVAEIVRSESGFD